jgi:hypothetical protein
MHDQPSSAAIVLAVPAAASTWTDFATIAGSRSAMVICNLDSSADDLLCPSVNPVIDAAGHVGIGTATPHHLLDVNGTLGLAAAGHINFGSADGDSGYGIRDNAGTIECKNSGGSWSACQGSGSTFAAGSAVAPGWAVSGDTDTGLFQAASSANTLSIAGGGKEIARFDNNGSANFVNYFDFAGGISGNPIVESAAGSDTDIGLSLNAKGAGTVKVTSQTAVAVGLTVKGAASQTGDLLDFQNSSGTVLSKIKSTGAIGMIDGSVSAPSLFFNSSTGTGLYYTATDTLNIAAGGSLSALFTNSGLQVFNDLTLFRDTNSVYISSGTGGIDGAELDVINTSDADSEIALTTYTVNNTATKAQYAYMGAVSVAGAGFAPALVFGQGINASYDWAERMRIDASGNVGIGTDSPLAKADVKGSLKVADGGETCDDAHKGLFRYNAGTGKFQVCR